MMNALRIGYVAGPIIGALWTFVMAVVACILVSFATGEGLRPVLIPSLIFGAWLGFVWLPDGGRTRQERIVWSVGLAILPALAFLVLSPAIAAAETIAVNAMVSSLRLTAARSAHA